MKKIRLTSNTNTVETLANIGLPLRRLILKTFSENVFKIVHYYSVTSMFCQVTAQRNFRATSSSVTFAPLVVLLK